MSLNRFFDQLISCLRGSGVNREPDNRTRLLGVDEFEPYLDVSNIDTVIGIVKRVTNIMDSNDTFTKANVDVEHYRDCISVLQDYLSSFREGEVNQLQKQSDEIAGENTKVAVVNLDPSPLVYRGFTEHLREILNILTNDNFAIADLYVATQHRVASVFDPDHVFEEVSYSASTSFNDLMSEMFVFGETLKSRMEQVSLNLQSAYMDEGGNLNNLTRKIQRRRLDSYNQSIGFQNIDVMSYVRILIKELEYYDRKLEENAGNKRLKIAFLYFVTQRMIDSLNSNFIEGLMRYNSQEMRDNMVLSYCLMSTVLYYSLINQRFNDVVLECGGK